MARLRRAAIGAVRGAVGQEGGARNENAELEALQAASGDPQATELVIGSILNSRRKTRNRNRLRKWVGIPVGVGAVALAGAALLHSCGSDTTASVPKAGVFKVVPEAVDCRAMVQSSVEVVATQRPHTPLDRVPILGSVTRAVDRSLGNTATFESSGTQRTSKGGVAGGVVDTLVCFKAGDVTVTVAKSGIETVHIPTRDVVTFTGIDESKSMTVVDSGDLASYRTFEATVVGGVYSTPKREIETGKAALEVVAREAAIDEGAKSCSITAWPDVEKAATVAYRLIAQDQYDARLAAGAYLKEFVPGDVVVAFDGGVPQLMAPYTLPNNIPITNGAGGAPSCTVAPNAFDPTVPANGLYGDATNQQLPALP